MREKTNNAHVVFWPWRSQRVVMENRREKGGVQSLGFSGLETHFVLLPKRVQALKSCGHISWETQTSSRWNQASSLKARKLLEALVGFFWSICAFQKLNGPFLDFLPLRGWPVARPRESSTCDAVVIHSLGAKVKVFRPDSPLTAKNCSDMITSLLEGFVSPSSEL